MSLVLLLEGYNVPTARRYWRVRSPLTYHALGYPMGCTELEMRATPGGSDQTTGMTAFASGAFSGYPEAQAINDNATDFWTTGNIADPGGGHWLGVDFTSAVVVQQITYQARPDAFREEPATLHIESSPDATNWTTITSYTGIPAWSAGETRTFLLTDTPVTAVSMAADAGTFTFTGQPSFTGYIMPAVLGTFSYTGQAAARGIGMVSAVGTFSYTGQAAGTVAARAMTADLGTFTYTGQAATMGLLYTLVAGLGTFSYTGQTAARNLGMAAVGGSFSYTGQAVGTKVTYFMAADLGTFSYSGQAMLPERGYLMPGALGTFSYTGQAAALGLGVSITAGLGTFSYTGQAATFGISATMTAAMGSFSYTGQSSMATLSYGSVPPSGGGATRPRVVSVFFG